MSNPNPTIPSDEPDGAARSLMLARNLACLANDSGPAVAAIARAEPGDVVSFVMSDQGVLTGAAGGRLLASRRRPIDEAERSVAHVDVESAAAMVVCGFGLGYHVRALAERLKGTGVIFVYEPDAAMLRAVFERIDHSGWMSTTRVILLTDAEDRSAIASAAHGIEGVLAAGVTFVDHAPSLPRLGASAARFREGFAEVVRAVRTAVVTTMCQIGVTLGNLIDNASVYAASPGIEDLRGCASGRTGILVSAGPSLARNIRDLADPGVRERAVIVAVQTALKPLLAAGVRPHFVVALDHASISARFYEGLTASDVAGVTLIAEPKASPAIFASYPGAVRCPGDAILDDILGPALTRERGELPAGATVAHLGYYFARHLGCDPVVLVGQDLGFTDGQYYSAGAAIHGVWAGELNEFNTLEMMEWQRIVRMRRVLHTATDLLGRSVYTDEQMNTYRVQFERDFAADERRGLSIIDATEGGVLKRHTRVSTLRGALGPVMGAAPMAWPGPGERPDAGAVARRVSERLREVRRGVWRVREISEEARGVLAEMLAASGDDSRVNRLIERVDALGERVREERPAYALVQHLNQTGALKRFKADRSIDLADQRDPRAVQQRRIERDLSNVSWLRDSADELGAMFDARLASPRRSAARPSPGPEAAGASAGRAGVVAVIPVEAEAGGLGTPRDLAGPVWRGMNALRLTLRRLRACPEIDGIVLATSEPERIAGLIPEGERGRVTVMRLDRPALAGRAAAVRAGRLWARSCWRGGIANLSVYDEVFSPSVVARALEQAGAQAAVLAGPEWCLIDPGLVGELIRRYRAGLGAQGNPDRLLFCHAAPGLGSALIDRAIAEDLARNGRALGPLASIGSLLGYLPMAPQVDPIAKPACVVAPAAARDLCDRVIADAPDRSSRIASVLDADPDADAARAAGILSGLHRTGPTPPAEHLILDLSGVSGEMGEDVAVGAIEAHASRRPDLALTLRGDPLSHPAIERVIRSARRAGVAGIHVRTPARADIPDGLDADVISVEFEGGTGADPAAERRVRELIASRAMGGEGLCVPWIVPRLTRRDGVYSEIEGFFDRWLAEAGACVIDPLESAVEGERIGPLPVPESERARRRRTTVRVSPDGSRLRGDGTPAPASPEAPEPVPAGVA
ncbi:MAG: motility associated factor glycosyltransferase family protein [Phycisphaeraceae bacterium]|nr:MAG: motility associated factor glycosyltransferase family protein [Phycisphaeraceae bacterium]